MNSKSKKQTVAIFGVGMMGGSLGLAIRRNRLPYHVLGIGRNVGRLRQAKKLGACDAVTTDFADASQADILVLCTPVFKIVPTLQKIQPYLKPGAIVTDIGSVKGAIIDGVKKLRGSKHIFIGGHPLAGSEKVGVAHSHPNLYENATVVLCPLSPNRAALKKLEDLWRKVGAQTLVMKPEIHDLLVARTSHLPHVLAGAFVKLVSRMQSRDPRTSKLLAGSFRDVSRIVDSDSGQWSEIACANRKQLLDAIQSYRDILNDLLKKIKSGRDSFSEWSSFFSAARKDRQKLIAKSLKLRASGSSS